MEYIIRGIELFIIDYTCHRAIIRVMEQIVIDYTCHRAGCNRLYVS